MGALYNHAKKELELLGEDPATQRGLLRVISAFAKMGHSGGSASVAIPMINDLLQYKNLTPITDDPDEWFYHGPEIAPPHGLFQSKRNPALFSKDGGKTYYHVDDTNGGTDLEDKVQTSEISGKREADDVVVVFEDADLGSPETGKTVEWDIDLNQPMSKTIRDRHSEKIAGMALDGASDEALEEAIAESAKALRPDDEDTKLVGLMKDGVVYPVDDSGEVIQSGPVFADPEKVAAVAAERAKMDAKLLDRLAD